MRVENASPAAGLHAVRRPEPKAPAETATTAPAPASPAPTQPSKASGVIDKLASGHFNDVAALRLRTNHAEAIAAAGVELPDAPTETNKPGQGFAKALAAYRAAMPPVPDPVAETLEDVVAEPVDGTTASLDVAAPAGGETDAIAWIAPLVDGLTVEELAVDALLDDLAAPVDEPLDVAL